MASQSSATAAPDPIAYMDAGAQAAVSAASDYKRRFVDVLDLRRGDVVLDLGCGPGTDLPRLAEAVGSEGRVIGVDHDPAMRAEAQRRMASHSNVEIRTGDLHDLPLPDGCAHRARTDRVLQHVEDPARVLHEVRRVLRPGGLIGTAEPDWDTLAVADPDVDTSRRFARFVAEHQVRNATLGRQMPRLAAQAGFAIRSVDPIAVCFRDFDTADMILGLRRNSARAIEAGALSEGAVEPWLERLRETPFVAGFTFYLVTGQAPR